MKNPIILKDLFIGINGMMGKITILVILFLISAYCIFISDFGINFGYGYYSNQATLSMGYIIGGLGIGLIALIKGILGVVLERSQQTYELIKISRITPVQFIMGKFIADIAYFSIILVMILPFGAYFLFHGGIVVADIFLLYIHLLLIAGLGSAIGILMGSITKNITLSFLLAIVALIATFFIIVENRFFQTIIESIMTVEDKNWGFFISLFLAGIVGIMLYNIAKMKQETLKNTQRYPIILSFILFISGIITVYFLDINALNIFVLIGILDIFLLFLNFSKFSQSEEKIFAYRFFLTVALTFSLSVLFAFWSVKLFSFILLIYILTALISVNTIEIYKKINIYLQKFIYIIVLSFIFLVLPDFVNNIEYKLQDKTQTHLYIQNISSTFENIIEFERAQQNNISLKKHDEIYFHRIESSFKYLYFMIIVMLLIYYTRHFFIKEKNYS